MGYKIAKPYSIGREKIEEVEPILNLIQKQQKELELKDKMIDLMTEQLRTPVNSKE